jgi:hypothetical protein
VVERAARAIDGHLLQAHIGEFETLCFYHEIAPSLPMSRKGEAASFSAALYASVGQVPGRDFCKSLIAHYRKA